MFIIPVIDVVVVATAIAVVTVIGEGISITTYLRCYYCCYYLLQLLLLLPLRLLLLSLIRALPSATTQLNAIVVTCVVLYDINTTNIANISTTTTISVHV